MGSTTALQIARGSVDDAPDVAALFRRARAQMTYLPTLHTQAEELTYFRQQLQERDSVLAWQNAELVGFAILSDGWLHHLYVDPNAQDRGIGTQLLSSAKALSEKGLQLWTFEQNVGARRFYERHGFAIAETTDGEANEERLPDVRYQWTSSAG